MLSIKSVFESFEQDRLGWHVSQVSSWLGTQPIQGQHDFSSIKMLWTISRQSFYFVSHYIIIAKLFHYMRKITSSCFVCQMWPRDESEEIALIGYPRAVIGFTPRLLENEISSSCTRRTSRRWRSLASMENRVYLLTYVVHAVTRI